MIKIIRYLKDSWLSVLIIIALLIVQAYCDLALPQYTSDVVDVGIQQGGIESPLPEAVREEEMKKVTAFMTAADSDRLLSFYENDNGVLRLGSVDNEERSELEGIISMPLLTVYTLENIDMSEYEQSSQQSEEMQLPEGMDFFDAIAMMPEEKRLEMRTSMEEKFGSLGESMTNQMQIAFVKNEYLETGVDTEKLQNDYLRKTGGKMLVMALIMMLVSIVTGFLASQTAAKFGMNIRDRVFKKVVSFSNAEMEKFSTASLITRSTNDIQQVQMVIVMMLRIVAYAPILGIGGIIKVIGTKTGLSWIIVVAVAAVMSLVVILMSVALPKFKKMQSLIDRLNLVTREILTGLPVIRAFSREKYEEQRFDTANRNLMGTQLFTNRVMTVMMPSMMLIMNGVAILIIWNGGKGIDSGTMQVGDMMAFITYTMQIIMSFLMLTMISIMLPRAAVSAGRINEVLETENSVADNDAVTDGTIVNGELEFDNVSFRYGDADADVLENISFTAKNGQTTAFIGSTGSGKSTLINLIPRFYDVTSGSIKIDGTDIRNMSQKYLRSRIGLVPQKGVLFSGTISSNISFGNSSCSEDEITRAADIAQASEFIDEKQLRYEEPVSQGGTNVSGGQKQRLSIARAIAKNPKIYIFDDSFSALDYKTDSILRKTLNEQITDATVLIVAQRISTIMNAEQIIVLDEGKIAGTGTHKELMKSCEVYRQIAYSQLSEKEINDSIDGEAV